MNSKGSQGIKLHLSVSVREYVSEASGAQESLEASASPAICISSVTKNRPGNVRGCPYRASEPPAKWCTG